MPDDSASDRRDFLRGNAAARILRDAIEAGQKSAAELIESAADPNPESAKPDNNLSDQQARSRSESYLETYTTRAMACDFEILFNLHQYPAAGSAAMRAFEMLEQFEAQMSIYRSDSELSRLNRSAFASPVAVNDELFELLSLAKQIFVETCGAFDMTSGPLSKLWGFDRRAGRVPEADAIEGALRNVGSKQFELNHARQEVRFLNSELILDPGGIGKGFALDRIAKLISDPDGGAAIGDFIIHGGQSSVIARGSVDPTDSSMGWNVGITHPLSPGMRLGEVRLRDSALGTSGTARQGFFSQGKRYGHIIDPRTGWPSRHILSSTVIAPSAAVADALATAFYVMQVADIESYCRANTDVAAILVVPENIEELTGRFAVHRYNVSDADWQPAG